MVTPCTEKNVLINRTHQRNIASLYPDDDLWLSDVKKLTFWNGSLFK